MAGTRSAVLAAALAAAALACGAAPAAARVQAPAPAATKDDWRKEFEDVCSRTQDAMALSSEELRSLVVRCDALKPVIEGLGESQRKVFGKRLRDCRAVYQFVLDTREGG